MKLLIKVCTRYGLVAGALSFILMIVMYYLGRHPLLIAPYLDFRILLFSILLFFGLKEFRDYHQHGVLYFWQAMIGSAVVVAVASVISSIGLQVFGMIDKDFVSTYVSQMVSYLQTFSKEDVERIGKDVFERNINQLPTTNISVLAITYFAQGLGIGFFVSIILSVILRRQPKN